MELGSSIRAIRKGKCILKRDFAALVGISTTALGQIENNNSMPRKSTLLKISETLEVPLSYIFFCAMDEQDVSEDKRVIFKSTSAFLKELLLQGKLK